ncbi:hypothetical protein B0J11DRAFT_585449 [Dendryphion nanum]|uniref:Uncharacterized protein n=1 Tax=Dendryphion nanum TaxID=256645 RepID=A0A9P9D4X9_9PLEO|nr:hypothetical protein B0J11DRAFT_585449 [Dendryphion nanum]
MQVQQRFDSVDLDPNRFVFDEELPSYEPRTAPEYGIDDYERPLVSFHLQQVHSKLQVFVPTESSTSCTYQVLSRSSLRLFSKRPNMEVILEDNGGASQHSIAAIAFDNDGPLPWRPRANVAHGHDTYSMESWNFSDWSVVIRDIGYRWRLEGNPMSLALIEDGCSIVIARFTYSSRGTTAKCGADIGKIAIFRDQLSQDRDGIESILCSLMVPIMHFKKMGKNYWNEAGTEQGHGRGRGESH